MHHVVMDGLSGAQFLDIILEPNREPSPLPEDHWIPKPAPNQEELFHQVLKNSANIPNQLGQLLTYLAKNAKNYITHIYKKGFQSLPTSPQAPKTCFNDQVSLPRVWDGVELPLAKIRAIGKAVDPKITINDVYLTLCSAALHRYLAEKQELPVIPLVASLPISIRKDHENYEMGNRVTQVFVQLATTEKDPTQRLKKMHEYTTSAKELYNMAPPELALTALQILPPFLGETGIPVFQQRHELNLPAVFNLSTTNIPGPRKPLYALGCELKSIYFGSSIYDGMGAVICAFSYSGKMTITITSCQAMLPQIEVFVSYLKDAYNELAELYLRP
ncbi:WS/DGAT domain-containing protein [Deltaproteobacteria bacterium TL4]